MEKKSILGQPLVRITYNWSPTNSPPRGDIEKGQKWFEMHNCSKCHGKYGKDGRAPQIASIDRNFSSFVRILRKPNSVNMPKFPEKVLSQQDAADIYTWLKSLPE